MLPSDSAWVLPSYSQRIWELEPHLFVRGAPKVLKNNEAFQGALVEALINTTNSCRFATYGNNTTTQRTRSRINASGNTLDGL